jgi:hypothetical protein
VPFDVKMWYLKPLSVFTVFPPVATIPAPAALNTPKGISIS